MAFFLRQELQTKRIILNGDVIMTLKPPYNTFSRMVINRATFHVCTPTSFLGVSTKLSSIVTSVCRHQPSYDTHAGIVINRVKLQNCKSTGFGEVKAHRHTEWCFIAGLCNFHPLDVNFFGSRKGSKMQPLT